MTYQYSGGKDHGLAGNVVMNLLTGLQFCIQLMLTPFKRQLVLLAGVEKMSANWTAKQNEVRAGRHLATGLFIWSAIEAVVRLHISHMDMNLLYGVLYAAAAFALTIAIAVLCWVEQYGRNVRFQQGISGVVAEDEIEAVITNNLHCFPGARALHGKLFVFRPDMPDEYSMEIDHLLVTTRNLYVIETKHKSGTVYASEKHEEWKVIAKARVSKMKNALDQALRTARKLKREWNFPYKVIPLVVIVGNDVQIVNGPSNVLAKGDLINMILANEQASKPTIDPEVVMNQLRVKISRDQKDFLRHVERAKSARQRNEQQRATPLIANN